MGRIAAIDYGLKRIGIALSDEQKKIALPTATLEGGLKELVSFFEKRKGEIETIVIGLPLLMNGTKGEMALRVEAFAKELEKSLGIPVVLFDERLTSKGAESLLREESRKKRTKRLDETAAALLLQTFLDCYRMKI